MSDRKALLVVSFGTSYRDNCEKTIGAIEQALHTAYPEFELRRAFTSGVIRTVLEKRDGIVVDGVGEALEKLKREGYHTVIVQPTHMMNGEEYESMMRTVAVYEGEFETLCCGAPALTGIEDYKIIAHLLMKEIPEWKERGTAVVLMGHGTSHHANSAYSALEYRLHDEGCGSMFVGTVEGYPDLASVMRRVRDFRAKKVVLYPFMIAAGDHVNHDMAGDGEDSWKCEFGREGFEVECVMKGLGEYEGIQKIFVEHARSVL